MNNLKISRLALAVGLAFSVGAMAESMTKHQYKSHEQSISAGFKAAKGECDSLSGNANDICVAQAKGNRNVAQAELEASYKPSDKARYHVQVAKADAEYSVAIERCDAKAGNTKDVCVKEAKAAKIHQTGAADAQLKTSNANTVANEKSDDANASAKEKVADAQRNAAADTRDANYVVAREKCDVLAGSAKDLCLSDAKVRFGKK
jgi:hypothetical protein